MSSSKALFNEIKDIKFQVNTVEEGFSPTQKFSELQLALAPKTFVRLENLIYFDCKILSSQSDIEPEKKCSEMLLSVMENNATIEINYDLEKHLVLEFMGRIMQHLSVECIVEVKHKSYVAALAEEEDELATVEVRPLGMGSKEDGKQTWYGTPDGRIRGVSPECADISGDVNIVGIDEVIAETDACCSNIEFKVRIKLMSQIVATAVVAAFTEHNLHSQHNPMIPTIVINCSTVMIVLYDCNEDILFISEKVDLFDEYGPSNKVKRSTLLFIWLFINHRSVSCPVCQALNDNYS